MSTTTKQTPPEIVVRARNLRFDVAPSVKAAPAGHWMGGDPVATAVFNALSLTFPDGEKMFIDAVKHFRPQIHEAGKLKLLGEIQGFIAQEGIHAREHAGLNRLIDRARYPVDAIEEMIVKRRQWRTENPPRGDEPVVEKFGWQFRARDKVMQDENNYDKEVFNGDIGQIARIDLVEQEVVVKFDQREVAYEFGELDELALAYAITIHKSQGSEFPAVVMPLAMQHYLLLQRNLLYTGVNRLPADFWQTHGRGMESWKKDGRAGYRVRGPLVSLDPKEVERTIRVSAYAGFLVGQAAAKRPQTASAAFTEICWPTIARASVWNVAASGRFISCLRRLTRFSSVPTAQIVPAGAAETVRIMNSVEPTRSALLTTFSWHSGWTITVPSGYCLRK